MALQAPSAVDVIDIQFKSNSKFNLINQDVTENKGNLLAAASVYGLVIVGSSEPNLKVIQLSRIVSDKDRPVIPSRSIPLPVPAHSIALSCDHSMLAVNFKQNDLAFVTIFSVPSFLSNNIKIIHQNIRLCTDDGVTASQLLWNPVLSNTLAVCLSNKSLLVFSFKDQGYDFYSIDKSEQVGCASWSPKGKQIVAGFPNGKIAQYKPDLKLARTIPCTVRLYNTAWDVIAVQWLSTYQFAAVMLPKEENSYPSLYIVYAPKNGTATYTNYNDVCYSQSGPRSTQIILSHILPWNLLLVISANSTEVGILGTTETGDNPLWKQYLLLDEARAELPLNNNKDETFPLGMDIDTGVTHRLVIDEIQIPVMAMLHLLSTNGVLISFNILNKTPNCPSINSPPQLVADTSGIGSFTVAVPTTVVQANASPPKNDISFAFPASAAATSTPRATQKTSSILTEVPKTDGNIFQNSTPAEPPKAFSSLFGGQTTIQPIASPQSAFSFVPKSTEPPSTNNQPSQASIFGIAKPQIPVAPTVKPSVIQTKVDPIPRPDSNKPFITVAPSFSQPTPTNVIEKATKLQPTVDNVISDDDIIRKMIWEEVQSYESLAKAFLKRCKSVDINIGSKEESQGMLKELMALQDVSDQATESTDALSLDIQSLKVSLSETYLMIAELKSKHSMLNDANYSQLNDANCMSHTSRRQLEKLEKLLAVNENQYRIVSQQINAHWSTYEENKKKNARAKMHVPTLENIYQTLTKQRDIVSRQRIKINYIKSRLGYKDNTNPSKKMAEVNINSLTDSMVSMSLCDQIKLDTERLSTEKLSSLRNMLKTRKVLQIAPKRPERTGLSSEIVMERRRAEERKKASVPKAVTTPKSVSLQPPQKPKQSIGTDFPKSSVPDSGFQLSKSTSKTELSGITNTMKPNSKVLPNKDITFSVTSTKDAKPEIVAFGSAAKSSDTTVKISSENVIQPFSVKPTMAFGGTSITSEKPALSFGSTTITTEKPGMSFGSSLFNNLGTPSFGTSSTQPSVLFGSTPTPFGSTPTPFGSTPTPFGSTPTPFGLQTTNTVSVPKNIDSTKPEKASSTIVANVQRPTTVTKTADKENAHKIEVPKPVLGGLVHSKTDTVQKPTAIQPISSNFGIVTSAPVVASSSPLTLSFGTTAAAKESSAPFNTISSGQLNEPPKTSFTASLPAAPIQSNAANIVPVSTIVSSSSGSDFSFSLDKMGIAPKTTTTTGNALQKPLFNLDPNVETSVATSSDDAEKLLGNLTFCKPTPTDIEKTTSAGGNIFSMSFKTPAKSENSSSIFGGNAATSPFSNFTGSTATTEQNAPTTQASVFASPFSTQNVTATSTLADTSSTGIFGKPDQQSPFGQQKTNSIFGGAATTTSNSLFGGTVATTPSTTIFGGNAFETASSTSSPFGATANAFGTSTSNAFGAASSTNTFATPTTNAFASSTSTSNIFGSSSGSGFASAGNAFGTSKSIFGGGGSTSDQSSTFGLSGGSLFGAPNAAAPTSTSPFSQSASQSTGSLFGGSSFASPQQSTGSIFGGASPSTGGSTGFGGQSAFGGASFSQQGQQSSPFAGAQQTSSTVFGSQPTFGGQATFGAAPTFGSPKSGFGSFANVSNTFGASPTQQNSLFETLGSTDTGLSFGNIAQNSNTASTQKTAFGGGSFSTWR